MGVGIAGFEMDNLGWNGVTLLDLKLVLIGLVMQCFGIAFGVFGLLWIICIALV